MSAGQMDLFASPAPTPARGVATVELPDVGHGTPDRPCWCKGFVLTVEPEGPGMRYLDRTGRVVLLGDAAQYAKAGEAEAVAQTLGRGVVTTWHAAITSHVDTRANWGVSVTAWAGASHWFWLEVYKGAGRGRLEVVDVEELERYGWGWSYEAATYAHMTREVAEAAAAHVAAWLAEDGDQDAGSDVTARPLPSGCSDIDPGTYTNDERATGLAHLEGDTDD